MGVAFATISLAALCVVTIDFVLWINSFILLGRDPSLYWMLALACLWPCYCLFALLGAVMKGNR